jgi:hypothetical protein
VTSAARRDPLCVRIGNRDDVDTLHVPPPCWKVVLGYPTGSGDAHAPDSLTTRHFHAWEAKTGVVNNHRRPTRRLICRPIVGPRVSSIVLLKLIEGASEA